MQNDKTRRSFHNQKGKKRKGEWVLKGTNSLQTIVWSCSMICLPWFCPVAMLSCTDPDDTSGFHFHIDSIFITILNSTQCTSSCCCTVTLLCCRLCWGWRHPPTPGWNLAPPVWSGPCPLQRRPSRRSERTGRWSSLCQRLRPCFRSVVSLSPDIGYMCFVVVQQGI